MAEKTKLVRIKLESWKTLQKLSRLSDRDMNALIEEWLTACGKALETFGSDVQRISLMSAQPDNDPSIVVTYMGQVFIGQIRLPNCLDDETQELLGEKVLKLDVAEKLRKRKKVETKC
jgi:hypothetical protein